MVGMIIILSLVCLMLVLSGYYALRPVTVIEKRQIKEMDKEALGKILIENVKSMRICESRGNGIGYTAMYREIVKANRVIIGKVNAGLPLQEAEKWLYENFYLVYRCIFGNRDNMRNLPHCNGEPRIVAIARIIVNNSLGDLTPQRIKYLFTAIKGVLSLNFDELRAFNNALAFGIIEQVYILAERLNYQNRCKKKAANGKFNKDFVTQDVYLYFLFQSDKLTEKSKQDLIKAGIEQNNIVIGFNNVLMRNTVMAETLFGALRDINSFMPTHIGLKYLGAYQQLSRTNNFENVSVDTLLCYFSKIERLSKRCGVSENYTADILTKLAKLNGKDISFILFDHYRSLKKCLKSGQIQKIKPSKNIAEGAYCLSIFSVAIGGAIALGFWLNSIFFGIFSFVPLLFIAENVINYLLSHLSVGISTPKMNYKKIPYEYSTLVVVSEFIGSMKQLKESIFHAQTLLDGNVDDNIGVALLIDTKGGDMPVGDLDNEIMDFLSAQNFDARLNVFLRKKSYSDKKYVAKERKRGAIMALNKLLLTKETFEFLYIYNENFITPNFVVTLDADNTVLPGEIKTMINMMAHPYNRKYDLLSMYSRNSLYSVKSLYAMRFIADSGFENYPQYSGLYYKLFKREIFCGKGIYRLQAFYNKLEDILPSKKILSHDILEGSLLNTGSSGLCFEDAPSGFISDRERKKRWQRGDIQLLPFMLGLWKTDGKKRCYGRISPLCKFIMLKNILYNVKEACILILLTLGLIVSPTMLYVALGVFFAPYLINQIKIFRGQVYKLKLSYIVNSTLKNLMLCVEDFFMLSYYSVSNLLVFFGTVSKMLMKKNLLEWKTYYNSQNSSSIVSYVREFAVPFAVWTCVFCVLAALGYNAFFGLIYILCSLLVFVLLYCASSIKLTSKKIDNARKEKLVALAENTYKYFCFMKNESGLIADNLQLKPYKGESKTTSPTNIGFSLLAEICAYNLNLISLEECIFNLGKIISAIEKLPKWNGLLYNWYNVESLFPANSFVSSVDNGNLMASLMLVAEFLSENGEAVNYLKVDLLIKNIRIEKLFDNSKNLFYIGFDGKNYCGHYDLLASEARILSFIYIALTNNSSHYSCLQKDYTHLGGNVLLSWSGTMFEMLMADIFFPLPKHSLLYETAKYNVKRQKRRKYNGIWGISESGYYNFDNELRYQYAAFGLKDLALCNEISEEIIAPYASVLALRYAPKEVTDNLERIKKHGGTYEYGLYESIDYSKNGKIIYSYMSHHQGMILTAITNFVCDDVLQKTLCLSPKISAVLNYFNDIQPNAKCMSKSYEKHKKYTLINDAYCKICNNLEQSIATFGLTDTQYKIICNANGSGFSKIGDININKNINEYDENCGFFFYIQNEQKQWKSPTYLPLRKAIENHSVICNGKEVIYYLKDGSLSQSVTLLPNMNGEVRKLTFDNNSKKIAFFGELTLNTFDGYWSHPVYNGMFFSARLIGADTVLISKRHRSDVIETHYVAMRVVGVKNIRFECNRMNFIGRGGLESMPLIFDKIDGDYPSFGDVLAPCLGFIGDISDGETECQVAIMYGDNEKMLLQSIALLPNDMYHYATQAVNSEILSETAQNLLAPMIYLSYSKMALNNVVESGKTEKFIEYTNRKKVIRYDFDEKNTESFNSFLNAVTALRLFEIEPKLAIFTDKILDKSTEEYVLKALYDRRIADYSLIHGICEEKYWYSLLLNSNSEYNEVPYVEGKRQIYRKLSTFSDKIADLPDIIYATGNGGFDNLGRYVCYGTRTKLPYSDVIADIRGGAIVTTDGGGYYYFGNSRENKAVRFDNDFVSPQGGEFVAVKTIDECFSILGGVGANRYSLIEKGKYTHVVKTEKFTARTSVAVICDGLVKISEIKLTKNTAGYVELIYLFEPALDWKYDRSFITFSQSYNVITVNNLKNGRKLHVKILGIELKNLSMLTNKDDLPYFEYYCEKDNEKVLILCTEDLALANSLNENNIAFYMSKSAEYFNSFNDVEIDSGIKSFDFLLNFLPYQIVSSRLNAKAGFYQVGGATGFRDQLQDSLAFFARPEMIKKQLSEACLHQYEEGDVMHWWHEPKYGLRTKITDDKLFLPYAACQYVNYSGDTDFFNTEFPYLSSPVLSAKEHDRFENPPYTEHKESVFKHCLRAIRSSLRYGEHRLLVMGSGDWNDGMDTVCAEGRGESVFNSMLCYKVLTEFAEFCPDELKTEMYTIATELKSAVNLYAWEEDRYKRLFSDDGKWYGSSRSTSLELDLLTQAFAVISGIADGERKTICMTTAKQLIDKDAGIIKLLTPPQSRNNYLGYISDYPKGIRENGGQYTHAAMWYLIALCEIDRQDEAYELFQMINPAEKCSDKMRNDRYMGEPYVLCGDIYSNRDNYGRMGWSWYTGSASWAYKLVTEYFYGIKRRGNELIIEPKLPRALNNSTIVYHYCSSSYVLEYKSALVSKIISDGETVEKISLEPNVHRKIVIEVGI